MLDTPTSTNPAVSLDKPFQPGSGFPAAPAEPKELSLRFTGSGGEYFRIWIVNLMLTVVTLGIYSAWAKVRRLQYFDRNTELDGAVFDFTGDPKAILRGRIVALVLLGVYQYAVGFSLMAGVVVAVALLAGLPFLMRGALRFRLSNTTYRGLRFHFTGSTPDAYWAYLPPMAALLLPAALATAVPQALILLPVAYLLWPVMHCVMKRYQHGNVSFASLPSQIELSRTAFYRPYLTMFGMMLLMVLVAVIGVAVFGAIAGLGGGLGMGSVGAVGAVGIFASLALVYLMMIAAVPYILVRTANLTWSATTFPGLSIASNMKVKSFLKLQVINTLLTIVTLGLYRPFAVVKTYQYRLAHMTVTADDTLERALATEAAHPTSASGDGVADFFDLDLSW